ncbi:AI-2E family transporter [Peredibacter starrii]|uniref:AI-2E family transporter n=1 Tax=Peredibacter starrii TaxID=28202 RepID=A0AAX4HPP8_9BACT|nr:AI-2E family transporter [Peredibacter starrii]WPU65301.1 AI-2E family transporter [Peredibacter starrii]
MKRNQKIKLYLFLAMFAGAVIFAILFPRLTLPFGFAYILYLMAKPFTVKLTTGSKKQRFIYFCIMLVGVSFMFFPLFATLYNMDTDFGKFSAQLPEAQKILQDKVFGLKVKVFDQFGFKLKLDPVNYVMAKIESQGADFLNHIPDYLSAMFEWMLLVPLFLWFFFMESRKFSQGLLEAIPNPIFEKSYVLFSQFNTKFGEYIIAKFIEATILGTLVTLGLLIVGFPYPFILGFVAGVTNILPYIGPVIGFVPAFFIALLSKDPNVSMLGMVVIYTLANLIDMILVFPLLVSKIVNLHPIVVVVSIIIGSQLGGIVGMIVIIPFIAFFKLLFKEIYKDLSVQL